MAYLPYAALNNSFVVTIIVFSLLTPCGEGFFYDYYTLRFWSFQFLIIAH